MPQRKPKPRKWTVVGFYQDNNQPYIGHVKALDAKGALRQLSQEKPSATIVVVDVLAGWKKGELGNDECVFVDDEGVHHVSGRYDR